VILIAVATAMVSGFVGLIVSYHLRFASGPAITPTASLVYGGSLLFNPLAATGRLLFGPHPLGRH